MPTQQAAWLSKTQMTLLRSCQSCATGKQSILESAGTETMRELYPKEQGI